MTIDRGYLEIWKDIAPHAFTNELPFTPSTAFLDGQLHLQRASFMHTWEQFMEIQFVNPLQRLFRWGATTVILSFDNYKYTPTAKQPTQRRRTTKIPQLDWKEQACLPSSIPENYENLIMNRVFKARVCQHVVANISSLIDLRNGRRLIIDYNNGSQEFTEETDQPTQLYQENELGESDVKFTSYLAGCDSFLADSIDGDYVVIAAMQLERAKKRGDQIPDIAVRRIALQPAAKKRLVTGETVTKRRLYEFVNINLLVESLQKYVASNCMISQEFIGYEIRLISFLVAVVGCDFTNGLRGVGPKRVWQNLSKLWKPLQKAFNRDKNEFCVENIANGVINTLLCTCYKKHIQPTNRIEQLLKNLRTAPTLSPSMKEKFLP